MNKCGRIFNLFSNLRCKTPTCANSQTTQRYSHESVVSLFRTICLLTSNLHTTSSTVFNRISDGYGAKRNPPGSLAKHNPARTLSSVDYKTHELVFLLIIKLHTWRKLFRYKLYIPQLITLHFTSSINFQFMLARCPCFTTNNNKLISPQ